MQKFLRGGILVECEGKIRAQAESIRVDGTTRSSRYSIIELAGSTTRGTWPARVQHHVYFVTPLSDHHVRNASLFAETPSPCLEQVVRDPLPGAFQLTSRYEGVGNEVLRLHGEVPFTGPVKVYIGEYSGPEHYNTAVLQAAGAAGRISKAWRALMKEHAEDLY